MRDSVAPTRPRLRVFAGPNGSGKTTFRDSVPPCGLYVNADDIKSSANCTDMGAALEAEKIREYCLAAHRDFSFETVLSTARNLYLIRRAKEAGYLVDCYFVLTADPIVNEFRVRARLYAGGHDVPRDKIHSRYYKSLANVHRLIPLCDNLRIVDNTHMPMVIYVKKGQSVPIVSENRYWTKGMIAALVSGQAVAAAICHGS